MKNKDKQRYENDKKNLLNQNKDKIEERNVLKVKKANQKFLSLSVLLLQQELLF